MQAISLHHHPVDILKFYTIQNSISSSTFNCRQSNSFIYGYLHSSHIISIVLRLDLIETPHFQLAFNTKAIVIFNIHHSAMSSVILSSPDEPRSNLRLAEKRQVPSSLLLPPAVSPRASLSSPSPSSADRRGSFSALHALFSSSTRDLSAPDFTDQVCVINGSPVENGYLASIRFLEFNYFK